MRYLTSLRPPSSTVNPAWPVVIGLHHTQAFCLVLEVTLCICFFLTLVNCLMLQSFPGPVACQILASLNPRHRLCPKSQYGGKRDSLLIEAPDASCLPENLESQTLLNLSLVFLLGQHSFIYPCINLYICASMHPAIYALFIELLS